MFMYDMELKYKKCIEMIGMVFVLCIKCFSFCNLRIEISVACCTSTKTTNRTIIGSLFFLHHRHTHKKIIGSSFLCIIDILIRKLICSVIWKWFKL
jgi:hypothetical protein